MQTKYRLTKIFSRGLPAFSLEIQQRVRMLLLDRGDLLRFSQSSRLKSGELFHYKSYTLWLLLFCFLSPTLKGQNDFLKPSAFTISIYNHSIGIPFKDYFKKPLNIGIAIGAEFTYRNKGLHTWLQKLEVGYFHHKNLNTSVWLKTDIAYRITTKNLFFAETNLGVGYMHDFNAFTTFALDENGRYQKAKNKGYGTFITNLGLGLGREIPINESFVIAPFVKYEGLFQMPYSSFQKIFPHTLLHLGSRVQFGN